jgi:hypothetical protein
MQNEGLESRIRTVGNRRTTVSRGAVGLACRGAGHQAPLFSTGHPLLCAMLAREFVDCWEDQAWRGRRLIRYSRRGSLFARCARRDAKTGVFVWVPEQVAVVDWITREYEYRLVLLNH